MLLAPTRHGSYARPKVDVRLMRVFALSFDL
jgi:hypothetical protein